MNVSSVLEGSFDEVLSSLVGYRANHFPVSSLYLTVDRARDQEQGYIAELKSLIKSAREDERFSGLSRASRFSLEEDWGRMLDVIGGIRGFSTKSVAIFSCSRGGLWQVLALPVTVPNALYFGRLPHINPLVYFKASFRRGLVFLVGRQTARIIEVGSGSLLKEVQWEDDVPQRVREGGWRSYEEKRIDHHVLWHLDLHLRKAMERFREAAALFSPDWVIIGGSDEPRALLKKMLLENNHPPFEVIATFDLPVETPADEILRLALEEEKADNRRKTEALLEMVSEGGVSGRATLGMTDTGTALIQGRLSMLLLPANKAEPGRECAACKTPNSAQYWQEELRCPNCGGGITEAIDDIYEALVHHALLRKTEVRFIESGPAWWDAAGHVAGIVRY